MVTLHEVITFLVSMQISISSLQTHNVNRCGRSRHLARKLSLRRKRSEERFSRNAETDLVCRLLLEKKKKKNEDDRSQPSINGRYIEFRRQASRDDPTPQHNDSRKC